MGIQINGQTDTISASDGSLSIAGQELTGVTDINASGIITATSFSGDGSGLTGIDATQIVTGNTSVQTVDTGSDGHVKINTEGVERVRIDSSGRVGIGTTTPSSYSAAGDNLVIADAGNCGITLAAGTSSTGQILFADGTTGADTIRGIIGYTHASNDLFFGTNAVERVRIDSSGRLGIGTSSPGAKLTVQDGSNAAGAILVGADYDGTGLTNNSIKLAPIHMPHYTNAEEKIRIIAGYSDASQSIVLIGGGTGSANAATKVQIFTATNTTTTAGIAAITVDSSQRVGIGTTSPSARLHVADGAGVFIQDTGGTERTTQILQSGGAFFVDVRDNTSDGQLIIRGKGGGTPNEYLRIDSSGRLLVGTSSSSGAPSSGSVVQLSNQFSVRAVNGGGTTNRYAFTASATTLDCVIDVPISGNIFSSFIGSLYVCQQLTSASKSFLAEYRVKLYNSGGTVVFTLVDSVNDSSPNNVALTFVYSNSNRQITVTSTWTTATSSALVCTLIGAGANT